MVVRLEAYATYIGDPFTEFQTWVLRHSFWDIVETVEKYGETHTERQTESHEEAWRYHAAETVKKGIVLVRQAIEEEKRRQVPTVWIRPMLRLPVWWEERYQVIFQTGLMWFISPVMQSAFLGAPQLGESRPWRSK